MTLRRRRDSLDVALARAAIDLTDVVYCDYDCGCDYDRLDRRRDHCRRRRLRRLRRRPLRRRRRSANRVLQSLPSRQRRSQHRRRPSRSAAVMRAPLVPQRRWLVAKQFRNINLKKNKISLLN